MDKIKLNDMRKRMLGFDGVMPFRFGVYHTIFAMPFLTLMLFAVAFFTGDSDWAWMAVGGWCIVIAQFVYMVIYDPPMTAREGKRKLYCIVSQEALDKMTIRKEGKADRFIRGKFAAQVGHAFLHSWWDSYMRFNADAIAYRSSPHAYKIALLVASDAQLVALEDTYRDICGVSLVTDAGFTVFNGQTMTCLGIGPILEADVRDDLKGLKLLT